MWKCRSVFNSDLFVEIHFALARTVRLVTSPWSSHLGLMLFFIFLCLLSEYCRKLRLNLFTCLFFNCYKFIKGSIVEVHWRLLKIHWHECWRVLTRILIKNIFRTSCCLIPQTIVQRSNCVGINFYICLLPDINCLKRFGESFKLIYIIIREHFNLRIMYTYQLNSFETNRSMIYHIFIII